MHLKFSISRYVPMSALLLESWFGGEMRIQSIRLAGATSCSKTELVFLSF